MWKCIRCEKENQNVEEKCTGCGHQIMVARKLVEKNTRQIVKRT